MKATNIWTFECVPYQDARLANIQSTGRNVPQTSGCFWIPGCCHRVDVSTCPLNVWAPNNSLYRTISLWVLLEWVKCFPLAWEMQRRPQGSLSGRWGHLSPGTDLACGPCGSCNSLQCSESHSQSYRRWYCKQERSRVPSLWIGTRPTVEAGMWAARQGGGGSSQPWRFSLHRLSGSFIHLFNQQLLSIHYMTV